MSDSKYKIDFTFSPSIQNVRRFAILGRNTVEFFWPQEKKLAFEVELSLVEALSNVLLHTQFDSSNNTISYQLMISSTKLIIRVFDQGEGFSLSDYFSQEADPYRTHGRGLQLIKGFMDDLKYIRGKNRNELVLLKSLLFQEAETFV